MKRRSTLAGALMKKISQTKEKMAKEKAEEDAENRKREARDKMHSMREKLDSEIDSQGLMAQLKNSDEHLAKQLSEDEALQKSKLD